MTVVHEPVLSVRSLWKSFVLHERGGTVIRGLQGVDLDVDAGEHVALAGPSGAGKSSLLKCVYRTYLPTVGQIRFRTEAGAVVDVARLDDRSVADLREREIGYVSQFLRAQPRRTALETVVGGGLRRGMAPDEAEDAAVDALRAIHLPEQLWHSYPSVLSGGERQRVNLARGTIAPPRLLLLDEPVSALDPVSRDGVLALLASLTARGVAVLTVFHDMDAIRQLATRVAVLRDGRVVDQGIPDEVLATTAPEGRD